MPNFRHIPSLITGRDLVIDSGASAPVLAAVNFAQQSWPEVSIVRHPLRGLACVSRQSIETGAWIGPLTGDILTQAPPPSASPNVLHVPESTLTREHWVVMTDCGNNSQFLSVCHSHNVNLVFGVHPSSPSRYLISIVATSAIVAGQELALPARDLAWRWHLHQPRVPCHCLRTTCPGSVQRQPHAPKMRQSPTKYSVSRLAPKIPASPLGGSTAHHSLRDYIALWHQPTLSA